jgi:Fe2+ transport system protein B
MKKNLKKEIRDKTAKARKGIKTNPILAIIIAAFIMFFLYFTFFTPMAQCKRALKNNYGSKMSSSVATLACQDMLKKR